MLQSVPCPTWTCKTDTTKSCGSLCPVCTVQNGAPPTPRQNLLIHETNHCQEFYGVPLTWSLNCKPLHLHQAVAKELLSCIATCLHLRPSMSTHRSWPCLTHCSVFADLPHSLQAQSLGGADKSATTFSSACVGTQTWSNDRSLVGVVMRVGSTAWTAWAHTWPSHSWLALYCWTSHRAFLTSVLLPVRWSSISTYFI